MLINSIHKFIQAPLATTRTLNDLFAQLYIDHHQTVFGELTDEVINQPSEDIVEDLSNQEEMEELFSEVVPSIVTPVPSVWHKDPVIVPVAPPPPPPSATASRARDAKLAQEWQEATTSAPDIYEDIFLFFQDK